VGLFIATPVPRVTEPPNNAATFLQAAVGVEQFRADNADRRIALHRLMEFVEPGWLDLRVVIEKDDIVAARDVKPAIEAAVEAEILRVADQPDPRAKGKPGKHRLVARAVVDDDDLKGHPRALVDDRFDAGISHLELAEDRDHN